jgi:Na+/proline symporter
VAEGVAARFAWALAAYFIVMIAVGLWARARIHDAEDYLVAGRRLPVWLATPTLVATWFGAGTLLTATDEIRVHGLQRAALDPLGAGLCLILAGFVVAGPLWRMRLLTLGDFFRVRFGPTAELWSAILMVPTYFGWIAAQFVALSELLALVFGLDPTAGLLLVAIVGTLYTLVGGMWSVTLTDGVQLIVVVIGLLALTFTVLGELGGSVAGGLAEIARQTPADRLELVPHERVGEVLGWLGVLAIGALGNLPGQDLLQRVFSCRSERTAVWSCHLAGGSYLALGVLPIVLGLAASVLAPGHEADATLGLLASRLLSPGWSVLWLLAVVAAVVSTITSAILSPASVLAENLLPRTRWGRYDPLLRSRACVVLVGAAAWVTALLGEDAYSLLEDAYALGLVSLFVPLVFGAHESRGDQRAALGAMAVGTGAFAVHVALGWESLLGWTPGGVEIPVAVGCAAAAAVAYLGLRRS